MKVKFAKPWFAPNGRLYTAFDVKDVPDHLRGDLPKTAKIVEDVAKKKKAPVKKSEPKKAEEEIEKVLGKK